MKSIFRLMFWGLMLSGWAVAALCLHVIRTPDLNHPGESRLVVLPKDRLGIQATYIDARAWTMADVPKNGKLILRMLDAGLSEQLKFLADPKSKQSIDAQLTDALSDSDRPSSYVEPLHAGRGPVHAASYPTR